MTEQRDRMGSGLGSASLSRRAVLVGLLGAAAGCGGGQAGGGQAGGGTGTGTAGGQTAAPSVVETPIMVRGNKANFHGEKSVAGKSSVTVDMYDFYFEPTVLVGSPGQRLTVNLLNEGQVAHTFTIKSQNVDVVLQPGQRGKTEVVFPESGKQGVVCRYHIAAGMLGLLAVKA